jgi:hypothetical protein
VYTDENGIIRHEPNNQFAIYPFSKEEEERLLEIKEQRGVNDDDPYYT